jgi:hypothetical protein
MTAGAISHRRPDQRFQRIMAEQVLYARDYSCEDERSTAITVWNHHYNYIDPTHRGRPTTSTTAQNRRHQRPALVQQSGGANIRLRCEASGVRLSAR